MDIVINGNKADITLDTEKNLGDVLSALETEFSAHNATTISISLDDKQILPEEFDNILDKPIDSVKTLSLTTISQEDVISGFIASSKDFKQISSELNNLTVMFQNGQDKTAITVVKKLADTIEYFCNIVTLASLFPEKFGKIQVQNMPISNFFGELAPILNDFEQALQDSDSVLIGDLAEYEINPRITSIIDMIDSIDA